MSAPVLPIEGPDVAARPPSAAIIFEDVYLAFEDKEILRGVSFQLSLGETKALFGVLDAKGSGYVKNAGTDGINFFHPGAINFRGHFQGDPKGIPSTHIPIDPKKTLPNNEWHVDRTFPYDGFRDWLEHAGCATHTACDPSK